jgi:hypothetical protein
MRSCCRFVLACELLSAPLRPVDEALPTPDPLGLRCQVEKAIRRKGAAITFGLAFHLDTVERWIAVFAAAGAFLSGFGTLGTFFLQLVASP